MQAMSAIAALSPPAEVDPIRAHIESMSTTALDREMDANFIADICRACFCALRGIDAGPLAPEISDFPVTFETIRDEVRRIRDEAREELREEAEATAQARARWIIEREVGSSQNDSESAEAADQPQTLPERSEAPSVAQGDAPRAIPPPPPGIDLTRGWPKRKPRNRWPREY